MRGYAVVMGSARALERYAWIGGVLYVVALITEAVISLGFKISQDDSAAKIANSLDDHHKASPTRSICSLCARQRWRRVRELLHAREWAACPRDARAASVARLG